MTKDLSELHPYDQNRVIAKVVTEAENPREELAKEFTSREIYDMLWGYGRSKYKRKDQRIDHLVRLSANMMEDYRHFDNEPAHTRR